MVAGDGDGNDGRTEVGDDDCLASDNERVRTAERARDDLWQHLTTNHRREQGGWKKTIPHNKPTMKIWLGGWGNSLLLRQCSGSSRVEVDTTVPGVWFWCELWALWLPPK